MPSIERKTEPIVPRNFTERAALRANEHARPPIIIDLSRPSARQEASELVSANPTAQCLDLKNPFETAYMSKYHHQVLSKTPEEQVADLTTDALKDIGIEGPKREGTLAYFPLTNAIIRYAPDQVHYAVRTASNRGLTKPETQQTMRDDFTVGFAGLSVGYVHELTATMEGLRGVRAIDDDVAEGVNFNRLPYPLTFHGAPKTAVLKELTLLLDPYARVDVQQSRLNEGTIDAFLFGPKGDKPLDLIYDEIDDAGAKDLIRVHAKRHEIDVVSIADLGDGRSKGDYEAYSTNPDQQPYNGRLETYGVTREKWAKMHNPAKIGVIIDMKHLSLPLLETLPRLQSGELPSWPQEAGTIFAAGGATPSIIKRRIEGSPIAPQFVIDAARDINPHWGEERIIAEEIGNRMMQNLIPRD